MRFARGRLVTRPCLWGTFSLFWAMLFPLLSQGVSIGVAQEAEMTSNQPIAIPAETSPNAEFGRFRSGSGRSSDSGGTQNIAASQNNEVLQSAADTQHIANTQHTTNEQNSATQSNWEGLSPGQWTSPGGIHGTLGGVLAITLLTLVPAIILMTTSFVRISVVLAMLRQAFGMPQIPPTQVITALSIFLTLAIMLPVWTQTYHAAVVPYSESTISGTEAIERGIRPIRDFMIRQIDRNGNAADIHVFLDRMPPEKASQITTYEEVPISVLLPAFLLSELKTAFWIGFRICLPFLVIDLVVAAILSAIGMIMVPPAVVAIPLKLLLFVLADGWRLLAGSLLDGFL